MFNNKPNFLVVGAPKSGTTSIYEYLKQHPQIYVNEKIKESNFFVEPKSILGAGPRYYGIQSYGQTLENYQKLFNNVSDEQIAIGEVCPTYLPFYENTIPNINRYLGNQIKIIIILRNPIDRAFSHYMHNVRDTDEEFSFEEALKFEDERIKKNYWNSFYLTKLGFYYNQVKAYKDNFTNVKVFLYEELKEDNFFKDLFEFLEVDSRIKINSEKSYNISGRPKNKRLQNFLVNESRFKKYFKYSFKNILSNKIKNKLLVFQDNLINKNIRKEKMKPETREKLKDFFKEDIQKLSKLINRDLSHWLN